MKKYLLIFAVVIALLLTACTLSETNPTDPSQNTESKSTETVPQNTGNEPQSTETGPQNTENEQLERELAYYNWLFSSSGWRNPYYNAKCIYGDFSSPEELNLRSFYDDGFVGEHEITDEELAEYKKLLPPYIPEIVGDFNRLPRDKVEEELQLIFGISLEDLPDSAFTGLYYLECSDSYCFYQSGVTSKQVSAFTDIQHNDDGTISLFYEDSDGKCVITLELKGRHHYQVLSNVHVE